MVLALAGSAVAQPGWEWMSPDLAYVEEVDPFTDEVLRYVAVYGREAHGEREAALFIVCRGEFVDVHVKDPDSHFGFGGWTRVQWRFDQHPPGEFSWRVSTDGDAVYPPTYASYEIFLDGLLAASHQLIIGVLDYADERQAYSFDMANVDEALERLPCL